MEQYHEFKSHTKYSDHVLMRYRTLHMKYRMQLLKSNTIFPKPNLFNNLISF